LTASYTSSHAAPNTCPSQLKILNKTIQQVINTSCRAARPLPNLCAALKIPAANVLSIVALPHPTTCRICDATVAAERQNRCWELHSRVKFDAVARGEYGGTCSPESLSVIRTSRINNPKGTFMKCASVVKAAAAVAVVVGMAGCTDLKPLQAQVDDLKAQVAKLGGDLSSARSSADQANSAAQSASQAASGAQSTANQALAAAHASQSCCDATNEKIDRMFKRSVSK
jgi:hypothetical protein